MRFIDNQQLIQTCFAHGSHPALGKSIGIRYSNGSADPFDVLRGKPLIKRGRKFGVVIMDAIADGWCSVFEFPAELSCWLGDPNRSSVLGTTSDVDAPCSQLDQEENADGFQPQGNDGEKVTG